MKYVHTHNLQNPTQIFSDSMHLLETGYHEVNADGYPNLGLHGVFGGAVESLDAEVLLDPLEEQLNAPAAFVNGRDSQGGQGEVVGEEDQPLASCLITVANAPELAGVLAFAFGDFQADDLVATDAAGSIHGLGSTNVKTHVAFGAGDEKGGSRMDAKEPLKIDVSTIHYVNACGFKSQFIKDVHVMHTCVCNTDEYRDGATKIHHRMQFDSRLGAAKCSPPKQRQAQVYGRGIQGINHLVYIQSNRVLGIQTARLGDEYLSQGFVKAPVAMLVGVGQVRARHIAPDAHRIQMRTSPQARLNVTQTLTECHLRKGHAQELITGTETTTGSWHGIKTNAAFELFAMEQIHCLGEYKAAFVHAAQSQKGCGKRQLTSNASHPCGYSTNTSSMKYDFRLAA